MFKRKVLKLFILGFLVLIFAGNYAVLGQNTLTIKGTHFFLNGESFEYTGISFFNALYNEVFNKDPETRKMYLKKFQETGINVLRVWCQWDNSRGFIDGGKNKTLYFEDGSLKPEFLTRLTGMVKDADEEGMVILLVLFSRESWNENLRLSDQASEKAVQEVAKTLIPFRNVVIQIWNENDYRTPDYYKIIKAVDPERLVTNSPGYGGVLGSHEENRILDYLAPHTTRDDNRHWEIAASEIGYLLKKYQKPVVDDEPARRGIPNFGGPKTPVQPADHILHMYNVWKAGGYVIYHHDMFQTGYMSDAVPKNGIPLPGFTDYHDEVFSFLKNKERYLKQIR